MKAFSKFLLFSMLVLLTSSIVAQQALVKQTGTTKPDKLEMLKILHGPTVYVENQAAGSGRAIGDDCTNPIVIGSLPYTDLNQTTTGRGNTYSSTCLNDFDGGEDIIYELTLLSQTNIVVELNPKGTHHTGIAISDGCPLDGTCLAISTDISGSGTAHGFTITLEAGVYYIMVDTWPNPTSIADFDLSITEGTLVINDDCDNAIAIGEVLDMPFSTTYATDDVYGVEGANIWYNYTAGFTGIAVISLCGSDYDTQIAVWDGISCPPTTLLDSNDDYCDLQSEVAIPVVMGNQYKIEIGGFDGDNGDGLLSIYEYAPCTLTCPGGSINENESCGSDVNGGCNMAVPAFKTVVNGNVVCGNLWSAFGTRDTDWFKIVLTKPSDLKMTLESEAITTFGLVGQIEPGVAGCDNTTGALTVFQNAYPCQEDSIKVLMLPKGTYYLFVGLADYFNYPCPGVNYIASFSVSQVESGSLVGTIKDGATLLPIEGVKVTAGDYFGYTNSSGIYNFPVPVGTYDVFADGYSVGYSSDTHPDAVVTLNTITYVDFLLDKLEAPTLLTAVAGIEQVTLTWAPASTKNSRSLMGDIATSSLYTPSSTVTLDFTMTIYSPDWEWGNYCELTFPAGFTPTSASSLNGVSPSIAGNVLSYSGIFYEANTPEEINFSVTMNTGAVSGPKYINYRVEGDGYGLEEHFFDGTIVVFQDGGTYVPVYKIYRQKGREYIYITSIINQTTYVDGIIPGGDEWCYQVTQIFEDLSESAPSNVLCATPLILPGSTCESPFIYGPVNNPAMTETLIRDTDARWYEFTVPYTMDVAISLCNSDFDTQLALYDNCGNFNGNLPTSEANLQGALAYNGDNMNWCGSNRSQIEYQMLPAGTYYAVVYGDNGEFGDYEIQIQQIQILIIRNGWSGISTYMNPSGSANIADVLENSSDSLIIVIAQNPYGMYWPSQNTNSIGNITPEKGYKAKMKSNSLYKRTDLIYGAEVANKTVNLPKGTSYLPVKVTALTDANDIVSALGANLMLLFDMNTNKIIWPAGGILPGNPGSLSFLTPGHAYLINMINAAAYTYPMPSGPVYGNPELPLRGGNKTNWNDVINTGISHFISISEEAQKEFQSGDIVGVFNNAGTCVGISEFAEQGNLFIGANGDDEYTSELDGLTTGEAMTYKLYRSDRSIYELEPTYSTQMPNSDGLFAPEGMSLIAAFKLSSTAISENQLSSLNLYPNPSTGIFNITGLGSNVKMTVSNAQGQEIYSKIVSGNTQLDMTLQPKGIYLIKFMNDNSLRIEKVVIK